MKIYEALQNQFIISTDKSQLNMGFIHDFLSKESYWAKNIPIETVQKCVDGSCCFGLYVKENSISKQIGFARVITDFATFGYLADVFIIETYRGKGLAKWLMEMIMKHPELQGLRGWLLATKDAHALYAQFGFSLLENTGRFMRLSAFDQYPGTNS
jgi:GNAT superfamily N-acetyltransferase